MENAAVRTRQHVSACLLANHLIVYEDGSLTHVLAEPLGSPAIKPGNLPGKVFWPVSISTSYDERSPIAVIVDGVGSVWMGKMDGVDFKQYKDGLKQA